MATVRFVEGDLLDQPVEVIVNAWNRNLIPWWLLLPHGVSGAIKRRAGLKPFIELRKYGVLPLGGAVVTSAGKLSYKGIIHVAGIGHTWCASEKSVRLSTRNALILASKHGFNSIAFPLIGAGTGGGSPVQVEQYMTEEIKEASYPGEVVVVKFGQRVIS